MKGSCQTSTTTIRGFTLIEFIIVTVLIAIALIGIMSYVTRASRQGRINDDIQGLEVIISSARTYKTNGSYGHGSMLPLLIRNHDIPTPLFEIVNLGKSVDSQWGYPLMVMAYGSYFKVFMGVPILGCVVTIKSIGNSDRTIEVGIGDINNGTKPVVRTNGVISTETAAKACGTGYAASLMFKVK